MTEKSTAQALLSATDEGTCPDRQALLEQRVKESIGRDVNNIAVLPLRKQYFAPGKDTWVLAILEALSRESDLSQRDLGRLLNISGAVINQHLRELNERKLIVFEARNGKSYRYVLTPAGEALRQEMATRCSTEAIHIYTGLKALVRQRLTRLTEAGIGRIVLFGASETCEVVLSVLGDMPFKVMALVDNAPEKQGTLFHGYVVSPPQILASVDCQAVLITSFGRQAEIKAQLTPLCRSRGLEIASL